MSRKKNYTQPIATVKGQYFNYFYGKLVTPHNIKCYDEEQVAVAERQMNAWKYGDECRVTTERHG